MGYNVSVVNDDSARKVDEQIRETGHFIMTTLSDEFPKVLRNVLYEIV